MESIHILHYNDIEQDLITFFKRRSLIPIVGSGISCHSPAYNGFVPSGKEYMDYMINELKTNNSLTIEDKEELKKSNFSSICSYYEDINIIDQKKRILYLKNNFYKAYFNENDIRKVFFNINWPYIYSLNIDDTIENSTEYNHIILPKRDFRENIFEDSKCLIKLHGDIKELITYQDGSKILTSKEYALSITQNAPLLNKLKNDYLNQNILYIGCSLDDEIDLSILSNIPIDFNEKSSLRKTIIFCKDKPSTLKISKFKNYGITDIIIFDNYNTMYSLLLKTWKESQSIGKDEIIGYNDVGIIDIKPTEKKENQSYFFWGKGLLNHHKSQISYPYYFISRDIGKNIIENLNKNTIHLILGGRISGKSYLLAGIYREIHDRSVYYFDGRSKISHSALSLLLTYKNIVVLLDVGSITREQFEIILDKLPILHDNNCNFIICINDNDSDMKGTIRYKLEKRKIKDYDIINYSIKNKLNYTKENSEKERFNERLPIISLPPYKNNSTFLDHIINAEKILCTRSQFTQYKITIKNYKQLALLLILATKEKIFSLEVINFSLDQEIIEAIKRYDPMIERVETLNYEKDSNDLSSIKYVLNSKYWLRHELGKYAQNTENHHFILEAFKYIIQKSIISTGKNKIQQRKNYKNYIMFDVLNNIFLNHYGGSIKLIVHIYKYLYEQLATDYNFLHQYAKCLLNYFYTLKNKKETEEKEKILHKAKESAIISKAILEQNYEESNNDRLLISIDHVQFTIASIMCNICKIHNYSDNEEINSTINILKKAIYSPYNIDNKNNRRRSVAIHNFIYDIQHNNELYKLYMNDVFTIKTNIM